MKFLKSKVIFYFSLLIFNIIIAVVTQKCEALNIEDKNSLDIKYFKDLILNLKTDEAESLLKTHSTKLKTSDKEDKEKDIKEAKEINQKILTLQELPKNLPFLMLGELDDIKYGLGVNDITKENLTDQKFRKELYYEHCSNIFYLFLKHTSNLLFDISKPTKLLACSYLLPTRRSYGLEYEFSTWIIKTREKFNKILIKRFKTELVLDTYIKKTQTS